LFSECPYTSKDSRNKIDRATVEDVTRGCGACQCSSWRPLIENMKIKIAWSHTPSDTSNQIKEKFSLIISKGSKNAIEYPRIKEW
jgi:hypothetical protein